MANQAQQMPIVMEVTNIQSLTMEQVNQIKSYIKQGTIMDVQFKDGDGEVMAVTGYVPEIVGDESTTPAVVSVVKNGSVVQANIVLGAPIISGNTPFAAKTEVSISADTGASIFYTTDGSTPTEDSTEYTDKFELSATTTVKAIAVNGTEVSSVASKTFTKS